MTNLVTNTSTGNVMICSFCHIICKSKKYLEDHLRGAHKVGDPFRCSCGFTHWWRQTFATHKKRLCPLLQKKHN